jgi:hypothetical protein
MKLPSVIGVLMALLCAVSCAQEPPRPAAAQVATATGTGPGSINLIDVTADSGIDLVTTSGNTPSQQILEVNGGGLALIDYDDDGLIDLFVANGATMADTERGPGSHLYRNIGGLRFVDVTESAGIDLTRWAMGATTGDYDGDGHDDLFVCCYGPNVLLRNNGDGTFSNVANHAGVDDDRWASSAAFGDLDGDGDLDLYVVNYLVFDPTQPPPPAKYKNAAVMAGPHGLAAEHDVLYENLGDGTFRNATESSGAMPPRPAYGLNVAILDLDADGRQDILVGNDSMANFLFHNQGDMTFSEMGLASGAAADADGNPQATMGIGIGDITGNGHPDVFTTNFSSDSNTLHLNRGHLYFDDGTQQYGLALVSRPYLGWACGLFDFDHDGDEDLIAFNGHVYPQATPETMDSSYRQPPLLFQRDGRRFKQLTPADAGDWLNQSYSDRAAAFGDLDGDGDVDMIVSELNGPVRVLRNQVADQQPNWLIVELQDQRDGSSNHRGLGSRVDVVDGDQRQRRWIFGGGGFQSSSEPAAHFGIAGDPEALTVEVTWPDGTVQTVDRVTPGQRLLVTRVH